MNYQEYKSALSEVMKEQKVVLDKTGMPLLTTNKQGSFLFECMVLSELEIAALFRYAITVKQAPIKIEIPVAIYVNDEKETSDWSVSVNLKINEDGEFNCHVLDMKIAQDIYTKQTTGYACIYDIHFEDNISSVEIGGEVFLDELLAIYSILQHLKREKLRSLK